MAVCVAGHVRVLCVIRASEAANKKEEAAASSSGG